ncbi:hypothetical protein BDZ97DRAFT_1866771 [Flammula alnicola]|nr:hypothetical protein BDZ97DRAFT_1866771 [Flammula alnicola]
MQLLLSEPLMNPRPCSLFLFLVASRSNSLSTSPRTSHCKSVVTFLVRTNRGCSSQTKTRRHTHGRSDTLVILHYSDKYCCLPLVKLADGKFYFLISSQAEDMVDHAHARRRPLKPS